MTASRCPKTPPHASALFPQWRAPSCLYVLKPSSPLSSLDWIPALFPPAQSTVSPALGRGPGCLLPPGGAAVPRSRAPTGCRSTAPLEASPSCSSPTLPTTDGGLCVSLKAFSHQRDPVETVGGHCESRQRRWLRAATCSTLWFLETVLSDTQHEGHGRARWCVLGGGCQVAKTGPLGWQLCLHKAGFPMHTLHLALWV